MMLIMEDAEREAIMNNPRFEDQKRMLLTRLLVRRACAEILGLKDFTTIRIKRTKAARQFLQYPRPENDLPNFNFHVSSAGKWVVLASEPVCLCAVDVADCRGYHPHYHKDFLDHLTVNEWKKCRQLAERSPYDADRTKAWADTSKGWAQFQQFWSLKQTFTQAIGAGIRYGFERCEFQLEQLQEHKDIHGLRYTAAVAVDGKPRSDWNFIQHQLGSDHWVTVARGPAGHMQDKLSMFQQSFRRPRADFSHNEWQVELTRGSPPFEVLPVAFCVPEADVYGYTLHCRVQQRQPPAAADPSKRPTMGSLVVILNTEHARRYFPESIGRKTQIVKDDHSQQPYQIPGLKFWLEESDVQEVQGISIGELVRCRDLGDSWRYGIVTSTAPMKVQADGWTEGCCWDEVQKTSQTEASRHGNTAHDKQEQEIASHRNSRRHREGAFSTRIGMNSTL
jgi:4'-phosphopantetheinyl transferase